MLTCHSCMRRFLQNLIGDSVVLTTTLPLHAGTLQRSFSSTSTPQSDRQLQRQQWLASRGVRPADKPAKLEDKDNLDFVVRKHLEYLQDPLKLADFVRRSLYAGDYETTLTVVRTASKKIQCSVSWNHLIDYLLSKGKMNDAIKLYNEMKKRAQMPDGHTYTILFRGCADHTDSKAAVAKALALYHSMTLDKSPIKPNTIHMNAVLKVCARAQDMDALFSIAARLPESGIGAPNNLTYTTIVNAIRINIVGDMRGDITPMQKRHTIKEGLLKVRKLWTDITKHWSKGDLWIDEELVCAIGRSLLVGGDQDRDDIFSLIEQTMNIPRQNPRRIAPSAQIVEPSSSHMPVTLEHEKQNPSALYAQRCQKREPSEYDAPENVERDTTELANSRSDGFNDSIKDTPPEKDQFEAIQPINPPANSFGGYAKPGRNTLSLILQAILESDLKSASSKKMALEYWSIITTQNRVQPDADNYHAMLRILRAARASSNSVELVRQMLPQYLQPKTFIIAFSACQRDKLNPHAFSNAGKLLDLIPQPPDANSDSTWPFIPILISYLDIAITSPVLSSKLPSDGNNYHSKNEHGQRILRALDRLNPSFINLKSLLAYGNPTSKHRISMENRFALIESTLGLTRKMIAALDILRDKGLVPQEMYPDISAQRGKLAAFESRFKNETKPSRRFRNARERAALQQEAEEVVKNAEMARMQEDEKDKSRNQADVDVDRNSHSESSRCPAIEESRTIAREALKALQTYKERKKLLAEKHREQEDQIVRSSAAESISESPMQTGEAFPIAANTQDPQTKKSERPPRRVITIGDPTMRENAQIALAQATQVITASKLQQGVAGAALRKAAEDALIRATEAPENTALQLRAMKAVRKVVESDKRLKSNENLLQEAESVWGQ